MLTAWDNWFILGSRQPDGKFIRNRKITGRKQEFVFDDREAPSTKLSLDLPFSRDADGPF
jgi:hypothetical protein